MGKAFLAALTGNIATFTCATYLSWPSFEIGKLSDVNETTLETPLTEEEGSWLVALLSLGSMFGPLLLGYPTSRIGRKYAILLLGPQLLVAALLFAFTRTVALLYVARFIVGLASGGVFYIFPTYVSELADSHNRGALNSVLNISVGTGLLFSYAVGPFLSIKVFNLILAVFPIVFVVLFFITGIESPHYYIQKNEQDLARFILQQLRGPNANVEKELMTIQQKIQEAGHGSLLDIFKSRGLTKAFVLCVGLLFFQQFCGMNAVMSYCQTIFESADVNLEPKISSLILGTVMFLSNFLVPVTVDRFGRKINLLMSGIGMTISAGVLGTYFYLKDNNTDVSAFNFLPIICLVFFVIFYPIGFASVPWILLGEMFPSNVKSVATSVISSICWGIAFFSTKYFAALVDAIGMGPCFWMFAAICSASIPFVQILVLETKGKTLHEIQDELTNSKK